MAVRIPWDDFREARIENAVVSTALATTALTRGDDYVSSQDLAHAEAHLSDALLWVRKAARMEAQV